MGAAERIDLAPEYGVMRFTMECICNATGQFEGTIEVDTHATVAFSGTLELLKVLQDLIRISDSGDVPSVPRAGQT